MKHVWHNSMRTLLATVGTGALLLLCTQILFAEPVAAKKGETVTNVPFMLEALVDFPDDALKAPAPVTPAHLDALMAALKARGVRRVIWGYYGDGHGGWFIPRVSEGQPVNQQEDWGNLAKTYQLLGNPLKVATDAAHRHGLELYANFKPYEMGVSLLYPEGSVEAQQWGKLGQIGGRLAWMDRFVVDHPDLRIKRRTDAQPVDLTTRPICAIQLVKANAAPTRLTKEHLRIWTSRLNTHYHPLVGDFTVKETVTAAAREIRDIDGAVVTRKGDPVRKLTLTGFSITDPFLAITTDFTAGPGDFDNTGTDILVALDAAGHEIPGVFATGGAIWNSERTDVLNWGLTFDYGFAKYRMRLDEPVTVSWIGAGLIGFARGRNTYLPGALCETEPAVQDYWLSCIREMLEAGVDGIDIREENHSAHTDFPEECGYNDVVLTACARRGSTDAKAIAQVRGDAYTAFLHKAKAMVAAAGKRMRYNLNLDWFRPDPPGSRRLAFPNNIEFQWRQWLDDGLMDEAILRFYTYPIDALWNDRVTREMIDVCQQHRVPITVNRYIQAPTLLNEITRVREDGRFTGFILYETNTFTRFEADNTCTMTMPEIDHVGEGLLAPLTKTEVK